MFQYWPRLAAIKLIKVYQKTLSFDYGLMKLFFPGGYCRFQPTCSEYGLQAISKYGVIKGGFKALGRVLRCHPLSKGGSDPLK